MKSRPEIEKDNLKKGLIEWLFDKYVIIDLDGSLSNDTNRLHFVLNLDNDPLWRKDMQAFHSLCGEDEVVESVLERVKQDRKNGYGVIILTGRDRSYWDKTEAWLKKHEIPFDHIFMRNPGDRRPSPVHKKEVASLIPKEKIAKFYEDDERNIKQFREMGFEVIVCVAPEICS